MKLSIRNTIYQAIIENKWIDISYLNGSNETTYFRIGVKNAYVIKDVLKIKCDIFNENKSLDTISSMLIVDNIKTASIVENSYYPSGEELLDKLNSKVMFNQFDGILLENNILSYLSDCYKYDNDPYIKSAVILDGLDIGILEKNGKIQLDENQFKVILDNVFKRNVFEADRIIRFSTLAMNYFSIDLDGKQYIVAYRKLKLNFKTRILSYEENYEINKSFLIEDKKISLSSYLDMNPDEFVTKFNEDPEYYCDMLRDALSKSSGEIANTRSNIFLLSRNTDRGVDEAFESINEMENEGSLEQPIKSFFGRNRVLKGTSKINNVVVFDKNKINIDQMRVIYNSMVNHVTFVKGPPGTGKTETIFNVLLSAYSNDRTVLICSNNNHPVNDIYSKMLSSFKHKNRYSKKEDSYPFPIIRLGNNEELGKTLDYLKDVLDFAVKNKDRNLKEDVTNSSKDSCLSSYGKLKDILSQYEEDKELHENIKRLKSIKTLTTSNYLSKEIEERILTLEEKLRSRPKVRNQDVVQYAKSANEDTDFQNYLYYSSLLKFKKLLMPSNAELVEIIKMESKDDAVKLLNRYLKDEKNLRNFLNIFPLIVTTNIASGKLGPAKPLFDLCVMDEAGQCNIASSLIPIVRGKDLLLVGDTNQLQPVTVIETNLHNKLFEKYSIPKEYNYIENSILSTMLAKDENSKRILLRYHYRCGQKIANFVNSRFYEQQLKLLNKNDGSLVYTDVNNSHRSIDRNSYIDEARAIVEIIKNNNYKDCGILTPFVNQANLINSELQKAGIKDIKAGTIHTLQGSEKGVIIFSSALSLRTAQITMNWIKNNHELINVAVTRAKECFHFVGDKKAIDFLNHGEQTDIQVLSDYVYKKGNVTVAKSDTVALEDFSNDSVNEKIFFETIEPYFKRKLQFRIEKAMPLSKAFRKISDADLKFMGQKQYDFAVQVKEGMFGQYRTIIAFEVDGGEHIGSQTTARFDRVKEEMSTKYGAKLIRVANNSVKDYTLIIKTFESILKGIPDIEDVSEQLSFNF